MCIKFGGYCTKNKLNARALQELGDEDIVGRVQIRFIGYNTCE